MDDVIVSPHIGFNSNQFQMCLYSITWSLVLTYMVKVTSQQRNQSATHT